MVGAYILKTKTQEFYEIYLDGMDKQLGSEIGLYQEGLLMRESFSGKEMQELATKVS